MLYEQGASVIDSCLGLSPKVKTYLYVPELLYELTPEEAFEEMMSYCLSLGIINELDTEKKIVFMDGKTFTLSLKGGKLCSAITYVEDLPFTVEKILIHDGEKYTVDEKHLEDFKGQRLSCPEASKIIEATPEFIFKLFYYYIKFRRVSDVKVSNIIYNSNKHLKPAEDKEGFLEKVFNEDFQRVIEYFYENSQFKNYIFKVCKLKIGFTKNENITNEECKVDNDTNAKRRNVPNYFDD